MPYAALRVQPVALFRACFTPAKAGRSDRPKQLDGGFFQLLFLKPELRLKLTKRENVRYSFLG